jgi:hypothetical protein
VVLKSANLTATADDVIDLTDVRQEDNDSNELGLCFCLFN